MQKGYGAIFNMETYMKWQLDNAYSDKPALKLQPKVIGGYSVSREGLYCSDRSELKFLVIPKEHFPLTLKDEPPLPDEHDLYSDYLDNMLYFIKDHQDIMVQRASATYPSVMSDIVTQHEVLQTLMCAPYMNINWSLLGTRYRNTIYLCMVKPQDAELCARKEMERKLKRFIYSDTPNKTTAFGSEGGGQFYGVFRCHIGGISFVYDALMGGNIGKPTNEFVECKIINSTKTYRQKTTKPAAKQALNWWSECTLKNIEQVYVGRAEAGIVHSIKPCNVSTVIRQNRDNWTCDRCISFMLYTMEKIGNVLQIDNPNAVYQFDYLSNPGILSYSFRIKRNEKTFISDWYRDMLS